MFNILNNNQPKMYSLVFWIKERSVTVLKTSRIKKINVQGKLMINYENQFYYARILAVNGE